MTEIRQSLLPLCLPKRFLCRDDTAFRRAGHLGRQRKQRCAVQFGTLRCRGREPCACCCGTGAFTAGKNQCSHNNDSYDCCHHPAWIRYTHTGSNGKGCNTSYGTSSKSHAASTDKVGLRLKILASAARELRNLTLPWLSTFTYRV